jgi:probable DNA metabolism protein
MILKVPGIGLRSTDRILRLRRRGRIRFEHLKQMGVVISRALPYIRCDGQPTTLWTGTSTERKSDASKHQDNFEAAGASRTVFVTDGTFEGLLTAIFKAYSGALSPDVIESADREQTELFDHRVTISTEPDKADRVWRGLKVQLGSKRRRMLFQSFLSGSPGVETMIFRFVRDMVPSRNEGKSDAHLNSHIGIEKLAQKVRREAHRMKGFIRFQKIGENQFLALIAPQFDVLPLIRRHFESRFADQKWVIYDRSRNYGLCYDGQQTQELRMDADNLTAFRIPNTVGEQLCQTLWKRYFSAVNVAQRNNPKLHLRQLPRRYWRYLPEKQI